jgi:osmotically inducible protein OsmC
VHLLQGAANRQGIDVFVEAPPGKVFAFSMESQFLSVSVRSFNQLREPGADAALAIRVRSRHSLIEGGEEMKRKASAVWRGDVKTGKGSLSTESTVLKDAQYSFSTRFENGIGTNPEELLAAAHAACFAMAVSSQLGKVGLRPEKLAATATITFEKVGEHFAISKSHLDLLAQVPGANQSIFEAAVKAAETGCPVSKLFKAEISVDARLELTV